MESSEDKQWAVKYLLDPLTAPEPNQETGPGSHFYSTSSIARAPSTSKGSSATVALHRNSKPAPEKSYLTPPSSASPTQSNFHPSNPYSPIPRQSAIGAYPNGGPSRRDINEPVADGKGRRRGSSLGERYTGDMSHRPLEQLRKEAKAADRAPHLKRRHMPGADIIDSLDNSVIGQAYHHGGPYDATLLARNTNYKHSPVEAVRESNAEALRATPREYIQDALNKHVPLQGTAIIPPGMAGMDGRPMHYEEGADLMREPDAPGGAYKRWEHVKYLPEDYKGKGEPSFSVESGLKDRERTSHRRVISEGNSAYEMQTPKHRPGLNSRRSASGGSVDTAATSNASASSLRPSDIEDSVRRSNTTGRRVGEGLKRRFGSLRRSKKTTEV